MTKLKVKLPKYDQRTPEQVREHYEIEKELAARLRHSTQEERRTLYTSLYDEMYSKIAPTPKMLRKSDAKAAAWVAAQRMELLSPFLKPDSIFLEVGPGDCSLAIEAAKSVRKVYAVDVSNEITNGLSFPQNFELIISDGCSIPVPENSVDTVYSHQLMEHLHPDDAFEQLQNIYKALKPRGVYICITPNRLSGPHDVSKYFDEVATGFHLKEYVVTELYELFRQVGFSKVSLYKSQKRIRIVIPLVPATVLIFKFLESLLTVLPAPMRRSIANTPMLFRGMTVVGTK
jgi:SAM-dependent methyltransferase